LASDGLAIIRADEGRLVPFEQQTSSHGLTLVHDPWRPVPSRGGHLGPEPGLCERADLDRRADVACFQTAPMGAPIAWIGRPLLRIRMAADQPGCDLWATLSVVRRDGSVLQCCSGVRRLLGEEALTPEPRLVELQPCWIRLEAGERLRLSLAASAWPAIAVNPGDGSLPCGGSELGHRVISLDLDLATSHLWLDPLIGAN
jgi:predicted acyl esterase